jgi:transposase
MSRWADAEIDRHQPMLMAPSLDEQLGADHGIRVLDRLLEREDWTEWEKAYTCEGAGRPPLHPRLLAGAILYGLLKRLRSTRELEEATRMRLDFRWWLEGRSVDHSTFSYFRMRFEGQIQSLFVALNRRAKELKRVTLEELLIDGTRLRADSDRHGARTAETLQKRMEALDQRMTEALAQLADEPQEASLAQQSEAQLRQQLERLQAQREQVEEALRVARERDAKKQRKEGKAAEPVRVPLSDPASQILPNKEGGYAPNYTPVAAVDAANGFIVGAVLADGNGEATTVPELVRQVQDLEPNTLQRVSFDGGFAAGQNLQALAEAGVSVYAPVAPRNTGNPALRADPTQPVPQAAWSALPRHGQQLDRTAFVYQKDLDQYRCPMGRALCPAKTLQRQTADGASVRLTEYRSQDCTGCPLAAGCLGKGATVRTVTRDQYEPLREAVHARMQTEQGRQVYARRAPLAEGVFAGIKQRLGIRRFSRRGRTKVAADWFWICTAYNLGKLLRCTGQATKAPHRPRQTSRRAFRPHSGDPKPLPVAPLAPFAVLLAA